MCCRLLALTQGSSFSSGDLEACGFNYHPFADDPHIPPATQPLFLSQLPYPLYPPKHCILNASKIELSLPPLSFLQIKPVSPTVTFVLVSVGGSTIWKFTSTLDSSLLSALLSVNRQIGLLLQLLPPQPSLCSGSFTQTISTTLWLFFLPPGSHSPQSNVSKMQIWPRHFSAWILSTVTINFKLSSGLKSSHDLSLPLPLPDSHLCSSKMPLVL